jgi:hypothetical protein
LRVVDLLVFVALLAPNQDRRAPVPSAAEQRTAEAAVRAVFGDEFATAARDEKRELARKLLAQSSIAQNSAAERYVLLVLARDVATESWDFATGLTAVEQLVQLFNVPRPATLGPAFTSEVNMHKAALLNGARKSAGNRDDEAMLAHAYLDFAEACFAAGQYADSASAAEQVIKLAKDSTLAPRAAEIGKDAPLLRRESQTAEQAKLTLASTPEDPAANLELGLHLLFAVRDSQAGLEHLSRGSDTTLANLAKAELAPATDGKSRVAIAERWLELARGEQPGFVRKRYQAHARELLEGALASSEGLVRGVIEQHLAELAPSAPAGTTIVFHSPETLSRFVTSGGTWTVEDGELRGSSPGGTEWATLATTYKAIECVTLRGLIVPPATTNFRIWVGPLHLIFNWEGADENHFRNLGDRTVTPTHALAPGKEHEIVLKQSGKKVLVSVDGRTVWQPQAELAGTVSVQAALGSTIAIRLLRVDGTPDPNVPAKAETREKP